MPYPWQMKQWEQLSLAVDQNRLAHALLLNGPEGSGMGQFAGDFSRYLLCEAPAQGAACETCRSCILFNAGNHPDVRTLSPEDNGAQIKVDVVRELIAHLQLSVQYGKRKIALLEPAEGMNWRSANSLLKTLEEPTPSTILILVSYQPARLPATIRSRCQMINFNRTDRQTATEWLRARIDQPAQVNELLELAGGAPLKALDLYEADALQNREEMLDDLQQAAQLHTAPIHIAEKWQKHDMVEALNRLLFLFSKMATLRAVGKGEAAEQSDFDSRLCRIASTIPVSGLVECYDLSLKNYCLLTGETNLNKQSLLEEIIVFWQSLHRRACAG